MHQLYNLFQISLSDKPGYEPIDLGRQARILARSRASGT